MNDEVQVANSNLLDYEDTTSHTITVQVTEDDSSQTSTQTFTINLNNLDDTDPTQPTLDNLTVDENAANDTVVGTYHPAILIILVQPLPLQSPMTPAVDSRSSMMKSKSLIATY